ncbi:hypothetical protein COOONC_06318, partial [Cooperia oncophora]
LLEIFVILSRASGSVQYAVAKLLQFCCLRIARNGYHCAENNICCGSPGACPDNNQPTQDKFGRLTACTSRNGNTCPAGSQCMATNIFSQRLCCEQTTEFLFHTMLSYQIEDHLPGLLSTLSEFTIPPEMQSRRAVAMW